MSDLQRIYGMKLHERISFNDFSVEIIRVAGGWVYESCNEGIATASVFVPLNNEFQEK